MFNTDGWVKVYAAGTGEHAAVTIEGHSFQCKECDTSHNRSDFSGGINCIMIPVSKGDSYSVYASSLSCVYFFKCK